MKKLVLLSLFMVGWTLLTGCIGVQREFSPVPHNPNPTLIAKYSSAPVVVDGKLTDPIWKTAPVYKMSLGADRIAKGQTLQESAEVQVAWDDQYFYVGVKFYDSDIAAEGKLDQLHHYTFGDLCELFLKPADQTWYWEMYVTPLGKKTSFWFPGRGRLGVPSGFDYSCGLKVAAKVAGTVNNWRDRDDCWTAEMAMPIKDLTAEGAKFGPGVDWRILVSRYNYSRYLSTTGPELSMVPQIAETNFHYLEGYGKLVLEK